jgi:hypothetical protein
LARVRAAGVRLGRPPGAKDRKRRKKRSVRNGMFLSVD